MIRQVSNYPNVLGVSRQTVNELVHCRRTVTPVMALRLSHLFGNSSMFWLNAQNAYDLWHAERRHGKELEAVVLLRAA
jgi:addiction module HigA family antidote